MSFNSRRTIRYILVSVLVLLFFSTKGFSQSYSTALTSDIDSVQVGQTFYLNVKIQINQSIDKLLLPDSSALPPEVDWLDTQQFKITDFADSLKIHVQFFGNSDVFIPGLPIGFVLDGDTTHTLTNNLLIPFKTVLETETAELKPIKPIFEFKGIPWAILVIALGVIAAAVWAYFALSKKEEAPKVVKVVQHKPFTSPLVELEQTLSMLKNEYNLPETQDFKYFYSAISDSIRKYFEDLYIIPALESTTREMLRYLDAFGVDLEMIKITRSVLNKADMVKFAKFTPTLDGAWSCHKDAITFLERAKLIDADRIARKKADYESQWKMAEPTMNLDEVPDELANEDSSPNKEDV